MSDRADWTALDATEIPRSAVTAYAPVRPDGTLFLEGMAEDPQSVFGIVCAVEGYGWTECEAKGWKCIAVKVRPI